MGSNPAADLCGVSMFSGTGTLASATQSKDMCVRLTGNFKLAVGECELLSTSVCVNPVRDCDLCRVCPASHSMTTGISSNSPVT